RAARAATASAFPRSAATSPFAANEGSRPADDRDPSLALFSNHSLHFGRGRGLAAFDHGQVGAADAEGFTDFLLDLGAKIGVLLDEQLRVLAALAEADVAVGEPGARLFDDLVLDPDVEQLAGLGDALAVADVELRRPERCCDLVLDHLHLHPRADHLFAFLDLA